MKIYHNPRCRKSRETLELIQGKGQEIEVVEYLKTPPDNGELKSLIDMLGISAEELIRKNEAIFKEQFKGKTLTEQQWIDVMVKYPKLIERPIVVDGNRAILGRPPQNVLALFRS